jgi:translation initiation factor IF-2
MMSVLEYALDINKTPEEVLVECKKLNIDVARKEDILDEEAIIMLDSIFETITDESEDSDSYDEEVESIISEEEIEDDEPVKKKSIIKKKNEEEKEEKKDYEAKRKAMYKSKEKLISNELVDDENIILFKEGSSIKEFANQLEINFSEIIKKLVGLGVIASVNDPISFATAEIIASEYNKELKKEETRDEVDFEHYEIQDKEEDLLTRPAVVTIMGHVDHGKTTLLDTIRKSNVVEGEVGGITQHIGAYQVTRNGKKITFIDTPGHAAFTEMRARGASVTDIVVIIVSAEDGVMPQTKEAIDHARAANVPIIVAINKIDKPNANPEKILTELTEYGLTPEEWGGDILVNKISALKGDGVDELLDNILLLSEMLELKANPNRYAIGTVIESKLDKKVGPIVTLLIQNGTLRLGDPLVVGLTHGRVRTFKNDLDKDIVEATPSMPVKITGLNEVPNAGDKIYGF